MKATPLPPCNPPTTPQGGAGTYNPLTPLPYIYGQGSWGVVLGDKETFNTPDKMTFHHTFQNGHTPTATLTPEGLRVEWQPDVPGKGYREEIKAGQCRHEQQPTFVSQEQGGILRNLRPEIRLICSALQQNWEL